MSPARRALRGVACRLTSPFSPLATSDRTDPCQSDGRHSSWVPLRRSPLPLCGRGGHLACMSILSCCRFLLPPPPLLGGEANACAAENAPGRLPDSRNHSQGIVVPLPATFTNNAHPSHLHRTNRGSHAERTTCGALDVSKSNLLRAISSVVPTLNGSSHTNRVPFLDGPAHPVVLESVQRSRHPSSK